MSNPRRPEQLRRIEGNRGHRRLHRDLKGIGQPVANPNFSAEELLIFRAIVDSAPEGVLCAADQAPLETMSIVWARYRQAHRMLGDQFIIEGKNGPRRNPLALIIADCAREMHRLGRCLGLSPASREKIVAATEDDLPDLDFAEW